MDFSNLISNVSLDEEFKHLEHLLENDSYGYMKYLRTLKLCWDLVEEKSFDKNTVLFRQCCYDTLHEFLCNPCRNDGVAFHGEQLLNNLGAYYNETDTLLPYRCACHYSALLYLLRSLHHCEDRCNTNDSFEVAYYDFTMLFYPFMNKAIGELVSGKYLTELEHILSYKNGSIIDFWTEKLLYWEAIKSKLEENRCDVNFSGLESLFLETAIAPDELVLKQKLMSADCFDFLISTLSKHISTPIWKFEWKRLYTTSNKNFYKKKNTKSVKSCMPQTSDSPLVQFMTSVYSRMVTHMNSHSSHEDMFSLSSSAAIDLYKYCSFPKHTSQSHYFPYVNGEKIHSFTLFPLGSIDSDHYNKNDYTLNFYMVYSPVNAIWKTGQLEQAISFYHFITDWVINQNTLSSDVHLSSFKELFQNYEFTIEPYSQKLLSNIHLIKNLKESFNNNNIDFSSNLPENRWQSVVHTNLKDWVCDNVPCLLNLIGKDNEVVASDICFVKENIIRIQNDDDVPIHPDLKSSYMIEFKRDNFVAFLLNLAQNLQKRVTCYDSYFSNNYLPFDRLLTMEDIAWWLVLQPVGNYAHTPKEERCRFRLSSPKQNPQLTVEFPVIIHRRSCRDLQPLTEADKKKVKECIMEFFYKRWLTVQEKESTHKKFNLIFDFMFESIDLHSVEDKRSIVNFNYKKVYEEDFQDPEITLLKKLVFFSSAY